MSRAQTSSLPKLQFHPATRDRWADLEKFFGKGGHAGCWCMWWRLKGSEFAKQTSEQRKRGLKAIVDSGEIPGLLAYADGEPVAWCSIGPRERFGRLERSPKLKRVDDQPVWSIVCFLVAKRLRGKGLMRRFLKAAVDYAKDHGARLVEGYPVEVRGGLSGYSGYTGIASSFRKAGFVEVLRRSERQPIMRYSVE
jgi:GNAT superfamily N-acetyltransferase